MTSGSGPSWAWSRMGLLSSRELGLLPLMIAPCRVHLWRDKEGSDHIQSGFFLLYLINQTANFQNVLQLPLIFVNTTWRLGMREYLSLIDDKKTWKYRSIISSYVSILTLSSWSLSSCQWNRKSFRKWTNKSFKSKWIRNLPNPQKKFQLMNKI